MQGAALLVTLALPLYSALVQVATVLSLGRTFLLLLNRGSGEEGSGVSSQSVACEITTSGGSCRTPSSPLGAVYPSQLRNLLNNNFEKQQQKVQPVCYL